MKIPRPSVVLSILLISVFPVLSSCARISSKSFSKRITQTQDDWRASGFRLQGKAVTMQGEQGRVQGIMNRLTEVSPLRGYLIPVMLTSNTTVNAGTDGRLVYVNAGLLSALRGDENLLAAVLAHELGHIIGHHAPRGNNQDLFWSAASPAASVHWIASLSALALREASKMTERAHNRYEEKEADAIAALITARAGYNPYALSAFLDIAHCGAACQWKPTSFPIVNYTNPVSAAQGLSLFVLRSSPFYKTHPSSPDRQKAIQWMAQMAEGKQTLNQLKKEDVSLATIYQSFESRRPKS